MFYFERRSDSSEESEPEPDIAILKGSPESFAEALPSIAQFIVEVAVSTLEKDRLKTQIYAEIEVPEYWIVDGDSKRIEIYTQPDSANKVYRDQLVLKLDETAPGCQLGGFQVVLEDLFKREEND